MNKLKLLSEYGLFLKNKQIEDLAEENRKFIIRADLNVLKLCKEISVEDFIKMSVKNLLELLTGLEEGKLTSETIEKTLRLELEALPGLRPEHIGANDLLSIYTAQKHALIKFIPKFTTEPDLMMEIIEELEFTFLKAID